MMKDGLDGAVRRAVFAALAPAVLLAWPGWSGSAGHDAMLEARHTHDAFAAVKAAAGPRMQVRKIQIG